MILTYFWAEDERNCDCSAELSPQESQEKFQVRSDVREYDCTVIDEKMRLISLFFLIKKAIFGQKVPRQLKITGNKTKITCLQNLK